MELKEALEILADGHTIISVKKAKKVCQTVGVPFREHIIRKFKSDLPGTFKGLTMKPGYENTDGVYTLTLSHYVAQVLGVEEKAGNFIGRGFQAQAYAEEIAKKLQRPKCVGSSLDKDMKPIQCQEKVVRDNLCGTHLAMREANIEVSKAFNL